MRNAISMYRMYAQVIGKARKACIWASASWLAPLLGNDRKSIELLKGKRAAVFAMPGTPVLYYGDEIGLGENICFWAYRNGAKRTPMQMGVPTRMRGFPGRIRRACISSRIYPRPGVIITRRATGRSNWPIRNSLLWWMPPAAGVAANAGARWARENANFSSRRTGQDPDLAYILRVPNTKPFWWWRILSPVCTAGGTGPVGLQGQQVPIELFGRMKFLSIIDGRSLCAHAGAAQFLLVLAGGQDRTTTLAPDRRPVGPT